MLYLQQVLAALMTTIAASSGKFRNSLLGRGHVNTMGTCTMAEFACRSESQCVALDQYCNGMKDCEDGSDEPAGCTPCNRTYYGRLGATYTITVPRPTKEALPHFCQLTFIASGYIYGDLVQISFGKFNLGRFMSHTKQGCPDGHMQIEELSRPLNTGYWCGTSLGTNTYYSETSAVTIMLRVFNISEDHQVNPAVAQNPQDSVILNLSYKFLQRQKAKIRYGSLYNPNYRGEDVLRTFCDKQFENCDQKNCKVQSPNFPGMYPRNITCFYRISQRDIPAGKVALIRVQQPNPHMIYIKDVNAPHLKRELRLYLNEDCHVLHDFIMIYDGNNTKSPLLLKACKGGILSPVTSSSSDLLIVFYASPYDFPFQDSPRRKVYGFHLDIEVLFVDIESTAYVRPRKDLISPRFHSLQRSNCEWTITSRGQRSGFIEAPLHSMLPNTTCIWRLVANPSEIVWMYFLYYRNIPHEEIPAPQTCPNTLTIHDGDLTSRNSTLMKRVCKIDQFPKVCSGVHFAGGPVACTKTESYISSGDKLSLSLTYSVGTIPAHIEFKARYEFVTQRQWGSSMPNSKECDRFFGPRPERLFASSRDVFMYGRGGNPHLKCVYTFQVERHQKITLRILRSRMGDGCSTMYRLTSKRHECSHGNLKGQPTLRINERLWSGVDINRACVCNISDTSPMVVTSYTNQLKLVFNIPFMSASKDFNDFYFEGDYEISDAATDEKGMSCELEKRYHQEPQGNFTIGSGRIVDACAFLPRIVTVTSGAFLFMRIKGFQSSEINCGVASRINIFAVGGHTPLVSICPEPSDTYTHVFSHGWNKDIYSLWRNLSSPYALETLRESLSISRDMIVEYIGNYSGKALVTWMEVWPPASNLASKSSNRRKSRKMEVKCPHMCQDIEACIPSDIWCDGLPHCPNEDDEGAAACGLLRALPWASLVVAGALVISLVTLLIAVVIHKISMAISRRRKRKKNQKKQGVAPIDRKRPKPSLEDDTIDPTEKDGAW